MSDRAVYGRKLTLAGFQMAILRNDPMRVVLANYSGRRPWRNRLLFASTMFVFLAFCVAYGVAYALLTPYMLPVLAIPLVILAGITIWSLPSMTNPPLKALFALFYLYIIASYVWPNYLAVALPGLPWMTVVRLVGLPMIFILFICLSTSVELKKRVRQAWCAFPTLGILIALFTAIQAVSILLSNQKGQSVDKFIVALTGQTALFVIASAMMQNRLHIYRFLYLLWSISIFVCLIGLWQYRIKHLPWAGHIPSFLQINDPTVALVMAGYSRAYTSVYRVTSTFTTPLGMSEFIAVVFPFILFFMIKSTKTLIRALAALSIPLLLYSVVLTDSRLGIVGCLLALLLYPLIIGLRLWRQRKDSLLGPAIGLAYPVIFAGVIASTFIVGHVRSVVWGSGAKSFSTQSRIEQWHLAVPLILHRPVGYGIGRAADTLGYAPFGIETIDSYYLSVALDYGILGAIVFYATFIIAAGRAAIMSNVGPPNNEDIDLLAPATISIVAWLTIKSVFSQTDNNGLIYVLLGLIAALIYRSTKGKPQSGL